MLDISNETKNNLGKILQAEENIIAAYVFGSRIKGTAGKKSDLDLALVVKDESLVSYGALYLQINNLFPSLEVDVRIVSINSSPLFLFQILKNGICIYKKEESERVKFEVSVLKNYYDGEHLRGIYNHYLKKTLN